MNTAIEVRNISKSYHIGQINTGTFSEDFTNFFKSFKSKGDPSNSRSEPDLNFSFNSKKLVWSLKDINFDVSPGDAVGIIGSNGAGKSTLLKILSRITAPTTGSIKIRGRVASLLEVGTGFHPELTGRENIYLNGAILGMKKHEINSYFDEIVDFSGVEKYLDTPVKRYSSGMYVRLAFAVAAHLQSEILIVDEVLAVGDAEFQKKCLGKLNSISKGYGRTVLFVSHNLDSIKSLCNKGLYLANGVSNYFGDIDNAINMYCNSNIQVYSANGINFSNVRRFGNGKVQFKSLRITPISSKTSIYTGDTICINLVLNAYFNINDIIITVIFYNTSGLRIFEVNNRILNRKISLRDGDLVDITYTVNDLMLSQGEYLVGVWAGIPNEDMDGIEFATNIQVEKNTELVYKDYTYQGIYQPVFNMDLI